MQWNCRSIKKKIGELNKLIQINKIDIVLLQETFLSNNQTLNIKNFNIIRADRNSQGGGVAIAIKNIWCFKRLNINSTIDEIEVIGCKIKINNNKSLDVVSLYINHNININMTHLTNIFEKVETPFIIGGDFNAHSMEWGCTNNSPRGEIILDALEKYDSVFLNDGSVTRIQAPPNQSSAIDLTITNSNNSLCCEWKVINATCDSDHFPIATTVKLNANKRISKTTTIISQKRIVKIMQETNWRNGMSMEEFMEIMHDVVQYAEIEIPKSKSDQNKPWWNDKCSKALALLFQLTKKFRIIGDRVNYDAMIEQQKIFKRTTKQAKKDGWFSFCSSISRESPISEIWKMAKIFRGNSRATYSNESCEEWIEEFMNKHSLPTPCNQLDINSLDENHNQTFENQITKDMVQNKINKLRKSASGVDKISNNILKCLPSCAVQILTDSFNNIIKEGQIPKEWKIAKVIPLQKPGKTTNEASSKRPISIFGKIRRLFESCFLENLERWAEIGKKYSTSQYGFRKGKSTRDCVASLITDVKIAWSEKKVVGALILDISAAYDNVNIEVFIKNLNKLGAPRKICAIMWEMYSQKINRYMVNNEIVGERISSIGFPQGLPSSPASFNLAIARINECLEEGVQSLQFADDVIVYFAGKNISQIEVKLNETLKKLNKFVSEIGLSFSMEKTKSILFSRKHQNLILKLKLDECLISQVESCKYVGITLDRKLLLNRQMKESAAAAAKALNIMRSVAGTRWGVDPRCLDILYKGCIRSKLEYCSFIYDKKSSIKILEKVQWRALRIITGCMQSTHTQTLEVLAAINPLKIRFQILTSKYLNLIYSYDNPLRLKLDKLNNNRLSFMSEKPPIIYQYEQYPFFRQRNWNVNNFNKIRALKLRGNKENVSEQEIKEMFKEEKQKYFKDCEIIFTDGSKKSEGTSYAVYHERYECKKKIKVNRETSIYIAESSAVLEALVHINEEHEGVKKVCVVTDSLSVVKAIENVENTFKTHFVIGEIMNLTEEMATKGIEINLLWVPSHKGIKGNEIVDELAQQALDDPNVIHNLALHFSEIPAARKAACKEKWQTQWTNSEKGRYSYSIIPTVKEKSWYKESPLDRKSIIFWNRIIANHTRSKDSLNRHKIVNSSICSCGKNYQTVNHLLFECEETISSVMLQKLRHSSFHPPWDIRDIIASEINKCDKTVMNLISKFMAKKLMHKKLI